LGEVIDMRCIDADALEKEGWSLHRTIRVDKHTEEYQTKPLKKVPTIEPDPSQCWGCNCEKMERLEPCEDTISRQDAIRIVDGIDTWQAGWRGNAIESIKALPSAQPEIIHCGECKHRDPEDHKCDCGHDIIWQLPRDDKWYCADAERRTDE
jgi:hypothetical protein